MIVKSGRNKIAEVGFKKLIGTSSTNRLLKAYLDSDGTETTESSKLKSGLIGATIDNITGLDGTYTITISYTNITDSKKEISSVCLASTEGGTEVLFSRLVFPKVTLQPGSTINLKYYLYF